MRIDRTALEMGRKYQNTAASSGGRGVTQRQLRVGELVRHAISDLLQREDWHDEALSAAAVTVTEVRMAPDLKRATCYVMPLGGENPELVVKALARRAPVLSHEIGRRVALKFTPKLLFQVDGSFQQAAHVAAILASPRVAPDLASETDEGDGGDGA